MSKKILMLLPLLMLGGCGLFGGKDDAEAAAGTSAETDAATTAGYGSETLPPPVEIGGGSPAQGSSSTGTAGEGNVIYFEYDSIEMTEDSRLVVANQGRYLAGNPAVRARLDGHADERGTREYNVGLAERRAYAVMQALLAAGAAPAQLNVISYGEERPAASGHDEAAWALNRRVEIVR